MIDRMLRAASLDVSLYNEVENDPRFTSEAFLVVVISSLALGLGSIVNSGVGGIVVGTLSALGGWALWSYLTYIIGTTVLRTPETNATWGQLLRTIGYASSPGVIRILALIGPLAAVVIGAAAVWMLITAVIAVRQALDYRSTARAVVVCIIGWAIQITIILILNVFGLAFLVAGTG